MKNLSTNRIVLIVVGAILIISIILGIPYIKAFWNKPLGEALDLPTVTPTAETVQATLMAGEPTLEPTMTLTPTSAPLCSGPNVMMIEALGENQEEHLTDVIRIARVDFVTPSVTVLDIPRDTWVQIPPLTDPRIQYAKINQAFQFGIDAAWRNFNGKPLYDGPGGGSGLMARTLDLNFGLHVDNYGTVDMQTFVKIVDAVGGIDVNLPEAVDGTYVDKSDPSIPAGGLGYYTTGEHHFDGQTALNFARIRKLLPNGTYQRTANQNLVLCALKDKLLTPSVLPDIPNIIASLQNSVQTDLSPAQISQLVCLLPHLKKENIVFAEPPEGMFTSTQVDDTYAGYGTTAYEVDTQFRDIIQQFVAGTWPTPQPDNAGSFCP